MALLVVVRDGRFCSGSSGRDEEDSAPLENVPERGDGISWFAIENWSKS